MPSISSGFCVASTKNGFSSEYVDFATEVRPMTYWPHPQLAYSAMTLAIRTTSDPASFAPIVEREVRALDRDQPVSDVRTMNQWVSRTLSQARFSSTLLTTFAWLKGEHDGFWYPSAEVGGTVVEGQELGCIRDWEGRVLQQAVSAVAGRVLFIVSSLAINRGDPLLAVGA